MVIGWLFANVTCGGPIFDALVTFNNYFVLQKAPQKLFAKKPLLLTAPKLQDAQYTPS
jgi:hypothetical protein